MVVLVHSETKLADYLFIQIWLKVMDEVAYVPVEDPTRNIADICLVNTQTYLLYIDNCDFWTL